MKTLHELELNRLMDQADMTRFHWRVWGLAAMGMFLFGYDCCMIGVSLTLIGYDWENLSPFMEGLLGLATLLGAVPGALIIGSVADRLGRKLLFCLNMTFVAAAGLLCSLSGDAQSLFLFRFLAGFAIGGDFPVGASYISSYVPSRHRSRMLVGGFSFQALGMVAGALAGLVILEVLPQVGAWRWMLGSEAVLALLVLSFRLTVPESTQWLMSRQRVREAGAIIQRVLPRLRSRVEAILAAPDAEVRSEPAPSAGGLRVLFSREYIRRTLLVCAPWFCMDIATYGIGIFTPLILASMVAPSAEHDFFGAEFVAIEGAAFVDLFLLAGFALNVLLVHRIGQIRIQLLGFLGMTAGLVVLASSEWMSGGSAHHLAVVFAGFILFNLTMNMGPNPTTYLLPAELFPTHMRASAHGFATACAKTGAALGTILVPALKNTLGISGVLVLVAGTSLLGFFLTALFRVDPGAGNGPRRPPPACRKTSSSGATRPSSPWWAPCRKRPTPSAS